MTAVAVDYRTPLLAFRAAVRAVRQDPGLSTLMDLSQAAHALPGGPANKVLDSEASMGLLRVLERAEETQLFARIDHADDTVVDLTRLTPSWIPAYSSDAMSEVTRLLALCHENRPDMEEYPLDPWTRTAEAGTRLIGILLRRTDARPLNDLMVRTSAEFAGRMRTAVAWTAQMTAAHFAEYAARVYGLFPIGPRVAQTNSGVARWSRVLGTRRYVFELTEGGYLEDFPHGRVVVRLSGSYEPIRTFALTARTRPKALAQFIGSL
ncbi:hypothetical protein ACIQ9R_36205 [Streptomyces sp. NPDC094447]|uniref:hypothetical protein n=1 Tax=Streptomyces sp. NPDC094447 TaxID=3366062 RepID=UPI00380AB04C